MGVGLAGSVVGGSPITGYAYRYKAVASTPWTLDWPAEASLSTTGPIVSSLTNQTAYTFEVRAYNAVGPGAVAEASATPQARTCPITGPSAPTVAENATGVVGQYTVGGAGCGSVSWLALGGADAGAGALQGAGATRSLHFLNTPDYETKPTVAMANEDNSTAS